MFNPTDPDVRRPANNQIHDLIAEARDALDVLEQGRRPDAEHPDPVIGVDDLVELARQRKAITGLPTSTRREGGAGSVIDDQGVPMPPLSDPVGEAVANAVTEITPAAHHLANVLRGLRGAVGDLRMATGSLARATPKAEPAPQGDDGCKVHARHGKWEPVYRNERCRWDYDFWIANGVDTPDPIMQARIDGRRVNAKMIDDALRPDPKVRARL